jgi:hypothetical protein
MVGYWRRLATNDGILDSAALQPKRRSLQRRMRRRVRCLTTGHAVLPGGTCDRCGARRRLRRHLLGA